MAPGGDWTDAEKVRYINRQTRLQKIGMNEMEAQHLAQRLLHRDRPDSGDDRKLCLECKSWRNKCLTPAVGHCTVPTMLQRCDGFMTVVA